ncbi:PAS domain S-box protein [Belnapia sp. T6]|uniref:histidine kinase n=1 Tax=Belnapia mucosa TaxID=2804532 RepID=A0ABS1VDX0_9PROT|nr:PAS domain-containing sensor histidine kinase [Belnapia mucosa]MBL6458603.1 PAS domain S-box protein [Belnapia mucosa]
MAIAAGLAGTALSAAMAGLGPAGPAGQVVSLALFGGGALALGWGVAAWRGAGPVAKALRASEARLLLAQEAAGIGTWDVDLRTGQQIWSAQQYALCGIDPVAGPPDQAAWLAMVHPEDRPLLERVRQPGPACDAATFQVQFRLRRASDGAERWIAASGRVERDGVGRPVRLLGIDRDVTEARQHEAALAAREAALRAMIEANPIGVLRGDIHGRIQDANDAVLRIIGRSRAELEAGQLRWDTLTPPEWLPEDARAIREAQATGLCAPYEKEYWRPDGSRVPVLIGYAIIGDPAEETITFILDLSERKRAERALLQSKEELEQRVAERTAALAAQEAELRLIYDRTPAAFHSCDAEGRVIRVSAEWLAFLGYRAEEVLGRRIPQFMTPASGARWEAALRTSGEAVHEVEYRMLRRDGAIVDVLLRGRVERDADGAFLRSFAVVVDITARNQAEARLREAQKLEALGRIAGGVAHDFNNILQVINGALRLLENRPDDADRVRRYTRAALEAADRGAGITRRMLAFARRDQLQSGPVPAAAVLEGLASLLHGPLGPDIRLEIALPAGLPPMQADRMQLDLVLFNLALNARDAMPAGGVLRLAATAETVVAPRPQGPPPGRYLRLTVTDTGSGMDAATLARATEPFFTTKEVGKGTGLGLAMAHGFAAQSGGALAIESSPGRGTTVTLWLPEAGPQPEPAPEPLPREAGRLRLLLVEDEAPVRGVMAAALREEGLAVTEALDAADALARLSMEPDLDLVLTDQAMPGMTGAALAAQLARQRPELPVVILTGNSEATPMAVPPGTPVLRKPIQPAELAARLRRLAAAAPQPVEA